MKKFRFKSRISYSTSRTKCVVTRMDSTTCKIHELSSCRNIPLVPGTAYCEMLIPCIESKFGIQTDGFSLKNIQFKEILYLNDIPPLIQIQLDGNTFSISSLNRNTNKIIAHHAFLDIELNTQIPIPKMTFNFDEIFTSSNTKNIVDGSTFYNSIANKYKDDFKSLKCLKIINDTDTLAEINMTQSSRPGNVQSCVDRCWYTSDSIYRRIIWVEWLCRTY